MWRVFTVVGLVALFALIWLWMTGMDSASGGPPPTGSEKVSIKPIGTSTLSHGETRERVRLSEHQADKR